MKNSIYKIKIAHLKNLAVTNQIYINCMSVSQTDTRLS